MQEKKFEFLDYLNNNGLYFYANTIEEFLLSLKLNNRILFNGIPGLDKTNLAKCYCNYYIESNELNKTITSNSKIGKTTTNNGFAVKRDHILDILPRISYEDQCEFIVDNIKVKAHLNILPRLFFKHSENEEFYEYLDEMKNEGINYITYKILLKSSTTYSYKIYNANKISKDSDEIKGFLENANENKNYKFFLIFNNITDNNISNVLLDSFEIPHNVYVFYCGLIYHTSNIVNNISIIDFKAISPVDYLQKNTQNIYFKNSDYLIKLQNQLIKNINELKNNIQKITLDNNENLYTVLLNELDKLYYILSKENIYITNSNIKYIFNYLLIAWQYEGEPEIFINWRKYFDFQLIQRIIPLLSINEFSIDLLTNLLNFCDDKYTYHRTYNIINNMINKKKYE